MLDLVMQSGGSSKASFTACTYLFYVPDTWKPKLNLIVYNVGQHWNKKSSNTAAFYIIIITLIWGTN